MRHISLGKSWLPYPQSPHLYRCLVRVPESVEKTLPDFEHVRLHDVMLPNQEPGQSLQALLSRHKVLVEHQRIQKGRYKTGTTK